MPSRAHVNWAKFRVLAVAVAASLILGTISFLLTGGTILEPKTTLYLFLDDATGLAPGSPVRVDGIGVGKVDAVELTGSSDPQRVIRVSMKVERDRLASITLDSTAQASSDTMIGDKFVDVSSGTSPQHLAPGAEIKYKGSTELMKSIDLSQFQQQIKLIEKLLDDIEQGRSPLGKFIAGDELYNQLMSKIRSLQQSMLAAKATTGAVGQALYSDAIHRQWVEPIQKLDESLAKLQSGQGSLGQMLRDTQQYEQARKQVADLRHTIGEIKSGEMLSSDRAYSDWTKQVRAIIQSVDTFNTSPMLTGSAVYENFNGMARELQSTVKDFREDPKKYLRVKIF